MSYFGFLLVWLVLPILLLSGILVRRAHGGIVWNKVSSSKTVWAAIGIQIVLALVYTTPWDNHLVATRVWSYNPRLVTGIILGYVPVEEYVFFVLETVLVGLWWQVLSPYTQIAGRFRPSAKLRLGCSAGLAILWLASIVLLVSDWMPWTYVSITLAWALLPIIIQVSYGADVLWLERKLVGAVILPVGIYLSAVDALAIRAGIWAIDPRQSTGLHIGNLPLEEGVFFFVTVILITFGLTLTLSKESRERFGFKTKQVAKIVGQE